MTATAVAVKVVDGLLRVNVIVAVSAARTAALLAAIATVGAVAARNASKRSTTAAWSTPKIMANELVSLAPGASAPMLIARLIEESDAAPLGSTGESRTSAGLLMKKPSADATARGSAEPSAIAPPAADPTTSRPSRSTSLDVSRLPSGSGSSFSSSVTLDSVADVRLVTVVVTTAWSSPSCHFTVRTTVTPVRGLPVIRTSWLAPALASTIVTGNDVRPAAATLQ